MKGVQYTEEIHAKNLLDILDKYGELCNCCPASECYNIKYSPAEFWLTGDDIEPPCWVCARFLDPNIKNPETINAIHVCPCNKYGKEDAYNMTMIALSEKGYL